MTTTLLDFTAPAGAAAFAAIDDRIMGGVSASRMCYDKAGHAVFEGEVSLDNGGGFASVRSAPGDYRAADATCYLLTVCGDGKRYRLNLRMDGDFDGINYRASFNTSAGQWQTVRLRLTDFEPSFRGRAVPDAPPLDPARVQQIGLMIAARQAGPFKLSIKTLEASTETTSTPPPRGAA